MFANVFLFLELLSGYRHRLGKIMDNYLYLRDKYLNKGYKIIGEGRNRVVFEYDEFNVIKIPKNEVGDTDNECEGDVANTFFDKGFYPKCRIIEDSETRLKLLIMEKVIPCGIDDISDIAMRFSKKYPTPKGITEKDIKDYHNVIFSIIKKPGKNQLFASVDYQAYFDPSLDSAKDINFSDFLSSVEIYNTQTFQTWLNKYYGEEVG